MWAICTHCHQNFFLFPLYVCERKYGFCLKQDLVLDLNLMLEGVANSFISYKFVLQSPSKIKRRNLVEELNVLKQ